MEVVMTFLKDGELLFKKETCKEKNRGLVAICLDAKL